MKQIIYSKFSNERNKYFAIRTDILMDQSGKKIIRKSPMYPEGGAHVQNILEWEKCLQEKYKNTCIQMNHGSMKDNSVCFEYLEGQTLENKLDELYMNENYSQLLEIFRRYIELIRKANEKNEFQISDNFRKIFGDFSVNRKLYAADVNNLDMVVSNIIVTEQAWNVIDYEWTFPLAIPVNFIIWRIIHYYVYETQKRENLQKIGFYELFDISQREQTLYEEMEINFQKYVINGMVPLSNMYSTISKGAVTLDEIREKAIQTSDNKKIQVYFDYGEGFLEKNSVWCHPVADEKYEITIYDGVRNLRIDPAEEACVVEFKDMICKARYDYEPVCHTNTLEIGKKLYLFADSDPQIIVSDIRPGTNKLCFILKVENITEEFVEKIKVEFDKKSITAEKMIQQVNDMSHRANVELPLQNQRVAKQEEIIADLNHRLYMAEKSFHEIQGSFCWKITKPIRIVGSGIRLFFRKHYELKCFLRNIKRFLTMGPKKMRAFNANERIEKRSFHIKDEIGIICNINELEAQRGYLFKNPIRFSVVVPLYNTPELYLRKMIESVLSQTYENVELCLADGSDNKHRYVKDVCKEYYHYDKRIKYKKLRKNLGIAENTNACLEMATGDYIALFDHDDVLHPSALYENMKMIEEKGADFLYSDENTFHNTIDDAYMPHYKPDFSPDYLRSINYICHLTVVSRTLLKQVGGFRKEFDGSQDYDLVLRLSEQARKIVHIPKVLYYWRAHENSVAQDISAKTYCLEAAKKALREHLVRSGLKGEVMDGTYPSSYRIRYELDGEPLISILIPNKDHVGDLKRCLQSIKEKSTYDNYEIIIIENNSELEETFEYYEQIKKEEKISIIVWEGEFNYSAINNYGVQYTKGEYILLLNNDVEVISPDWLQEMLMYAQRKEVGAVGAKLYYANDTVQHAGVIVGLGGVAGHSHKFYDRTSVGYFIRLAVSQNLSAVTAACLMIKKSVYDEVNGLNTDYKVAFNDVDFCMRIRKAGYLNVFTPYAELYHYESISRGAEDTPEKIERFNGEVNRFKVDWKTELEQGDPYYNPNLSLDFEDFRAR